MGSCCTKKRVRPQLARKLEKVSLASPASEDKRKKKKKKKKSSGGEEEEEEEAEHNSIPMASKHLSVAKYDFQAPTQNYTIAKTAKTVIDPADAHKFGYEPTSVIPPDQAHKFGYSRVDVAPVEQGGGGGDNSGAASGETQVKEVSVLKLKDISIASLHHSTVQSAKPDSHSLPKSLSKKLSPKSRKAATDEKEKRKTMEKTGKKSRKTEADEKEEREATEKTEKKGAKEDLSKKQDRTF